MKKYYDLYKKCDNKTLLRLAEIIELNIATVKHIRDNNLAKINPDSLSKDLTKSLVITDILEDRRSIENISYEKFKKKHS